MIDERGIFGVAQGQKRQADQSENRCTDEDLGEGAGIGPRERLSGALVDDNIDDLKEGTISGQDMEGKITEMYQTFNALLQNYRSDRSLLLELQKSVI